MADSTVYRVILKKPEGDQTLSVEQFLALSPVEQTNYILEGKVSFMDDKGNPIPNSLGIRSLRKA